MCALALVLAGCTGTGGQDGPRDADDPDVAVGESLEAAWRAADAALAVWQDQQGDPWRAADALPALRRVEAARVDATDGRAVHAAIEMGAADALVTTTDRTGSLQMAYCTRATLIVAFGAKVTEIRRVPGGPCGPLPPAPGEADNGTALQRATMERAGDGGLVASYLSPADGGTVEIALDATGRPLSVRHASPASHATAAFEYGPRRPIEVPAVTDRYSVEVHSDDRFAPGVFHWRATATQLEVPLDDLEVRVMGRDDAQRPVVATGFPLEDAVEQSAAGFRFQFDDADDDGHLTAGDTFVVEDPQWRDERTHWVLVWDLWADRGLIDY